MSGPAGRAAVSVVVPFFGDAADAAALLDALGALALGPADELIVADNTGAAVVSAALAGRGEAAPVRVVAAERERGSYYARNVGAEAAGGEWLLFVDSDCRPAPDLIERYLAEPLVERVGIVAGGVVAAADQQAVVARYARSRGHISEQWHVDRDPYPAGVTANLLVRRSAWESMGGFHEGVRSGADVEFCWRLQRSGWQFVHRPEARVEHRHPERLRPLLAKTARHAAGRIWVNRMYRGAYERPRALRPLVRSAGGALVWTLTARFERARFKLIDGLWAGANLYGHLLGDNRAERPGESAPGAGGAPAERRVLYLTDAFPARSETFIYHEARELRRTGWTVRFESSARPLRPERGIVREFEISYLEDDPFRAKLAAVAWLVARHPWRTARDLAQHRHWRREEHVWRLASIAPAARRLARAGEHHIHVHFAAGAALHALRLSQLVGTTWSVAPHAYDIFQKPRNLREKLEQADFVVSDCDYNVEHLRGVAGPEHRDRIHRVVVGVNADWFRRETPYPGGRTVVTVGRFVEKKGFEYLVDAAALLRERGALDRVVICGDGPLRPELERRIEQHALDGAVELVDAWGPQAVRERLEQADLFCLPCVVAEDGDRDSMPVVVKEALAMELPVVGSDEVGMPEMVLPGWGRLVPSRDPVALADAIAELLDRSGEQRAAMGAAGREFVIEHCSLQRETAKLAKLISAAITSRRP